MTAHGPGLHDYPFIGEPPQPQPPRKRWYRRRPVWIGGGVVVLITALIAILAAASTPSTKPSPTGTPSTAQAVSAWWTNDTETDWTALTGDMSAIADAAGNYDIASMHTACSSLQSDTAQFRTHLPSPDAALNQHMSAATSLLNRSATACMDDDYSGAADLASQASTEIDASTARVNALS
jgi:hypothetical protein